MNLVLEQSAGVVPFRVGDDGRPLYLVLHSATVRNPRARWEFPKGGMEVGETPKQTAAREFLEETGLVHRTFIDGFERSLSYTFIRRGRKVLKTVTYYLVEVHDPSTLTCSFEHAPDPFGHWHHWGTFEEVNRLLYHTKIRQLFAEADELVLAYLRGESLVDRPRPHSRLEDEPVENDLDHPPGPVPG